MARSTQTVEDAEDPGPMTVEQYFRWREGREEPWEYVAGRPVPKFPLEENPLVAMASGTANHHTIQLTCASLIGHAGRRAAGSRPMPRSRFRTGGGFPMSCCPVLLPMPSW